jgi:hypothetical protein
VCASSGNDPWSLAYMRSLLDAVASVVSPFPLTLSSCWAWKLTTIKVTWWTCSY